jgi:hypothetical protein
LISFEHKAPYRGVLLVDPAETTVDAAFDACTHSVFPAGGESVPVGFKFEASSKVDLSSINTVINLAHAAEFGDPLEYHRKFDPIQPTLVADVDRSAL